MKNETRERLQRSYPGRPEGIEENIITNMKFYDFFLYAQYYDQREDSSVDTAWPLSQSVHSSICVYTRSCVTRMKNCRPLKGWLTSIRYPLSLSVASKVNDL